MCGCSCRLAPTRCVSVRTVPITSAKRGRFGRRTPHATKHGARVSEPAASAVDVYASDDELAETIEARGFNCVASPEKATVNVVTEPTATTIDAVADGANVIVLPGRDGQMANTDAFSLTELPEGGSWNLCASLVTQTLFDEVNTVPGYAFEDLYPYAYVDEVDLNDTITVGYAEGWVANVGGILLTRSIGEGTLTVCTLRVTDAYGRHPVATAILDRLLDRS
jgi:hypothetical protein